MRLLAITVALAAVARYVPEASGLLSAWVIYVAVGAGRTVGRNDKTPVGDRRCSRTKRG